MMKLIIIHIRAGCECDRYRQPPRLGLGRESNESLEWKIQRFGVKAQFRSLWRR